MCYNRNYHQLTIKVKQQIFLLGASYKQFEVTNSFCKSNQIADWTTDELKSKRPDLSWYIAFGNGVCRIGNNGGVPACAKICQGIDGCQYFSVSTTVSCHACFIYKSCDSPISSPHDYKIYKMQGGNTENQDLNIYCFTQSYHMMYLLYSQTFYENKMTCMKKLSITLDVIKV